MSTLRRLLEGSLIARDGEGGGGGGAPSDPPAPAPAPPGGGALPAPPAAPDPPAPAENDEVRAGLQRRIDALTAEKWQGKRETAQLRQELEQLKQRLEATPPSPSGDGEGGDDLTPAPPRRPVLTEADVERRARELASETAEEMNFRQRIDTAANEARRVHQDFDSATANLQKFGPLPKHFFAAVLEAERSAGAKAGEIIYSLGKDLNEADRILSLSPIEQAVAIAGFATRLVGNGDPPSPSPSNAPPPIRSRAGGGAPTPSNDLYDPNMTTESWMKLRNEQVAKSAGTRR